MEGHDTGGKQPPSGANKGTDRFVIWRRRWWRSGTEITRLIARPTSEGVAIAPAASRYLRQSVSPRPAPIILPPIFAPVHPRNRHTQVAGRCDRGRRSRRLAPRPTTAVGSGGRASISGCLNATAALRARRFASDLIRIPIVADRSKNCGDREEAKPHNAGAKSDNKERKKECKKECHSSE